MMGIGYWVFDVHVQDEHQMLGFQEEAEPTDAVAFDTKTVYKTVVVEDNGGVRAYYRQDEVGHEADFDDLRKRDGRIYVPMAQVHKSPPNGAIPYREVVSE